MTLISVTTGMAGSSSVRLYNFQCRHPRDADYLLDVGGDGAASNNSRIYNSKLNFDKTLLLFYVNYLCGVNLYRGQINSLTVTGKIEISQLKKL